MQATPSVEQPGASMTDGAGSVPVSSKSAPPSASVLEAVSSSFPGQAVRAKSAVRVIQESFIVATIVGVWCRITKEVPRLLPESLEYSLVTRLGGHRGGELREGQEERRTVRITYRSYRSRQMAVMVMLPVQLAECTKPPAECVGWGLGECGGRGISSSSEGRRCSRHRRARVGTECGCRWIL